MTTHGAYYSERHGAQRSRDQEEIGEPFWGGFIALYRRLLAQGFLAESFPDECPDGTALVIGGDAQALRLELQAELPGVECTPATVPSTMQILDTLEFFARRVSKPGRRSDHPWFGHDHVGDFDRGQALAAYRADVNRLLARSGHPYELDGSGFVQHVAPPVLREALSSAKFHTGDAELDRLISVAVAKFSDPDAATRAEGLEKLWDAWERLKTILPGDKKQSITQLLSQAISEPNFRSLVEREATELTSIGNSFMIRHTETDKTKIEHPPQVDYLFHRLFALIFLVLRSTGRASV